MYSKAVAVLIFAFVIFSNARDDQISPYDIWDDADDLMEELVRVVTRAQFTSYDQTGPLKSHLIMLSRNTSTNATIAVQDHTDSIVEQLHNLEILAEALGRPQCLDYRHDELQVISEDLNGDILACVGHIHWEFTNTIMNVSIYINDAWDGVFNLTKKMEECPRSSENVQCVLVTMGEMHLAMNALPAWILDETLRVLLLGRGWENGMAQCVDHRLGLMFGEGSRIVNEVERCLTSTEPNDF